MTLGGLALAVGILVDDATVEIENIHRNLQLGKRLVQAILDGAQQIATPAFVSTLSHLHRLRAGRLPHRRRRSTSSRRSRWRSCSRCWRRTSCRARSSRRLVRYLLGSETRRARATRPLRPASSAAIHTGSSAQFERLRTAYVNALEITAGARRSRVLVAFAVVMASGAVLLPFVGRDFFPDVDAGQFRLHVRAPAGTRIEETEQTFAERRGHDPRGSSRRIEIQLIIDNIGQPRADQPGLHATA